MQPRTVQGHCRMARVPPLEAFFFFFLHIGNNLGEMAESASKSPKLELRILE